MLFVTGEGQSRSVHNLEMPCSPPALVARSWRVWAGLGCNPWSELLREDLGAANHMES